MRHHRRFIPLLWGEQRVNDYYKDFPHGGRLDMRFTRANNVNGTLYSEDGYTVDPATIPEAEQGMPAPWAFPVPIQHYSHMLNYDYFKVNQPYVRLRCISLVYCYSCLRAVWFLRSSRTSGTGGGLPPPGSSHHLSSSIKYTHLAYSYRALTTAPHSGATYG